MSYWFLANLQLFQGILCFPILKITSETLDVNAQVPSGLLSFVYHPDFNIIGTQ